MEFPEDIAPPVKAVIKDYSTSAQIYALNLRELIYETSEKDVRIGPLTETLKWGEPSYLTDASHSGTTLRFDWKPKTPNRIGLFVNCRTSLIAKYRDLFEDALTLDGTRAIWLDLNAPLPRDILSMFISDTLTYHLGKTA
jgi:hypothetical protein